MFVVGRRLAKQRPAALPAIHIRAAACEGTPHAGLRGAKLRPADLYEVETVRQQITAERRDLRRACDACSGSSLRRDAMSLARIAGLRAAKLRPAALKREPAAKRRSPKRAAANGTHYVRFTISPLGTEPAAPPVTAVPGGHVRSSAAPLSPTARPSIPQGAASAPCGGRGRWSRCRGRAPCPARPPAAHWPTYSRPR